MSHSFSLGFSRELKKRTNSQFQKGEKNVMWILYKNACKEKPFERCILISNFSTAAQILVEKWSTLKSTQKSIKNTSCFVSYLSCHCSAANISSPFGSSSLVEKLFVNVFHELVSSSSSILTHVSLSLFQIVSRYLCTWWVWPLHFQMLLLGLILCCASAVVHALKPTTVVCSVARLAAGTSYAIVYATLLVKLVFLVSLNGGVYLPATYQSLLLCFAILIQVNY